MVHYLLPPPLLYLLNSHHSALFQADPLADLVTRYFHRQDRPTRNPSLTATLDGEDYLTVTEELMDSHCWRTLAIYCQRYMTHRRPRDPAIIFRLWHCRFLSLMRLRFYSEMDGELQRLGPLDRTELYYDSHPTIFPDRTGPMVPFEMRVLAAQLPAMMGDIIASLDLVMELSIFSRKMSLLLKEEEGSDEDSFVSSDEESQYSRASEAEGPTSAHEAGLNGLDDIGLEGEGLEEFGQMERPRSKPNRASIVPSPDLSTEWKLRVAPLELLAASYLMKLKVSSDRALFEYPITSRPPPCCPSSYAVPLVIIVIIIYMNPLYPPPPSSPPYRITRLPQCWLER